MELKSPVANDSSVPRRRQDGSPLSVAPYIAEVGEQIDTRSAAGRLVLNVLASVSQWEWGAIAERTATGMQHKAEQGEYTGESPPYGSRVGADGRLEAEAQEQEGAGDNAGDGTRRHELQWRRRERQRDLA